MKKILLAACATAMATSVTHAQSYTTIDMGNGSYYSRGSDGSSSSTMNLGGGISSHSGRSADGTTWSGTSTKLGGDITIHSGSTSNGNSYNKTCYSWGC